MDAGALVVKPEHLTPHDLVTYSRCPFEMEVLRARRASVHAGAPVNAITPINVVPERHSPLFAPPLHRTVVNDGRLDLLPSDTLIYEDEGEDDLPMLFAPERIRPDPRFEGHHGNLNDDDWQLSGRPDLIVRRADGSVFPIEYKATHLFTGYHESHGRAFDTIQAIAECRLVHVVTGVRPTRGVVLYGDAAGDGEREGWVMVPYGDAEEHWLKAALTQVRTDTTRAPVPAERNCASCEANRDQLCRFAGSRYDGPHRSAAFLPMAHR
jgi:hypothetical protein